MLHLRRHGLELLLEELWLRLLFLLVDDVSSLSLVLWLAPHLPICTIIVARHVLSQLLIITLMVL